MAMSITNSADTDEMPHLAASHLCQHNLYTCQLQDPSLKWVNMCLSDSQNSLVKEIGTHKISHF